ncbi:MAG: hypothetical protein DLM73_10950, partial [Chthoniobacterales bacterium]
MTVLLRRRVLIPSCIVAALVYSSVGHGGEELTIDDIIARNTEAMGGRTAIEAVKTIAIDLHIVDPGFAVDGTYQATRPDRMRIDVKANGKLVFVEAFDGKRGWQWNGKETTTVEASPKASAALRRGVEFPGKLYGLHELNARGHKIELVGRERIDGVDYYALKATMSDGFVTTFYV